MKYFPEAIPLSHLDPIESRRLEYFFEEYVLRHFDRYKYGHWAMACYAALPAVLTPDLVHKLWLNFKEYSVQGTPYNIHPVAPADLLLSPLVEETGYEQYEMVGPVREALLHYLQRHAEVMEKIQLTLAPLTDIASFLLAYSQRDMRSGYWADAAVREAQEWTALSYLDPGAAFAKVAQAFEKAESGSAQQMRYRDAIEKMASRFELSIYKSGSRLPEGYQAMRAIAKIALGAIKGRDGQFADLTKALARQSQYISERPDASPNAIPVKIQEPIEQQINASGKLRETAQIIALVAGVDDPEGISLPGPAATAKEQKAQQFAKCLKDLYPKEGLQMELLIGPQVTRDSILSAWKRVTQQAGRQDTLLFFLAASAQPADSGHCQVRCYDTDMDKNSNWLQDSDIGQMAESSIAGAIVAVIDADSAATRFWLDQEDDRCAVFAACQNGSFLLASSGSGESPYNFTDALCRALRRSRGRVSRRELFIRTLEYLEQDGALWDGGPAPQLLATPLGLRRLVAPEGESLGRLQDALRLTGFHHQASTGVWDGPTAEAVKAARGKLHFPRGATKQAIIKKLEEAQGKEEAEGKPVFLLLFCPNAQESIYMSEVEQEQQILARLLDEAFAGGGVMLEIMENPTAESVKEIFQRPAMRNRIHWVHFAGLGTAQRLGFADRFLSPYEFLRLLEYQENLRMVFFNACQTASLAEWTSLLGGRSAIGMEGIASDQFARAFGEAFYRKLESGMSIEEAYRDYSGSSSSDPGAVHRGIIPPPEKQSPKEWPYRLYKASWADEELAQWRMGGYALFSETLELLIVFPSGEKPTREEADRIRSVLTSKAQDISLTPRIISLRALNASFAQAAGLRQVAIVHFTGGEDQFTFLEDRGMSLVYPEVSKEGENIARMLGREKSLKLVFLNHPSLSKITGSLLKAGVPAVLAASAPAIDREALTFAEEFYTSLSEGYTLREAFERTMGSNSYRGFTMERAERKKPWGLYSSDKKSEHWTLPRRRTASSATIPHLLTAPPLQGEAFAGREDELEEIKQRLQSGNMLLISGEAGIGKTAIAARYFHLNEGRYAHAAWVSWNRGEGPDWRPLRSALGIAWNDMLTEAQRVEQVIDAMAQLEGESLLVFDGVNEADQLKAHSEFWEQCPNLDVIATTRCRAFRSAPVCRIGPLPRKDIQAAFKKWYPALEAPDEAVHFEYLNEFARGNTVVLELLAKTAAHFRRLPSRGTGYGLRDLKESLDRGLFELPQEHRIEIHYPGFGLILIPELLDTLYDLSALTDEERETLSYFAALPPAPLEFSTLDALAGQLGGEIPVFSLADDGWLEYLEAGNAFSCSRILREVVRHKNPQWRQDCQGLVQGLAGELRQSSDPGKYAVLGEAVVEALEPVDETISDLCEKLGAYFRSQKDWEKALRIFRQLESYYFDALGKDRDNEANKQRLVAVYSNLEALHTETGGARQAEEYVQKRAQLTSSPAQKEKTGKQGAEPPEIAIKAAIGQSDFGRAFELALDAWEKDVVFSQLQAEWNRLKEQERRSAITPEDSMLIQNRIIARLVDYLAYRTRQTENEPPVEYKDRQGAFREISGLIAQDEIDKALALLKSLSLENRTWKREADNLHQQWTKLRREQWMGLNPADFQKRSESEVIPGILSLLKKMEGGFPKAGERPVSKGYSMDAALLEEQITNRISQGETGEALNLLLEATRDNKEKNRQALQLKSRFERLRKQEMQGTISVEAAQMTFSQIASAILSVLEEGRGEGGQPAARSKPWWRFWR